MRESRLLLVNKPRDISSFAVVKKLKWLTKAKKVGHIGTLDPFATDLLPIAFNKASLAEQYIHEYDKEYLVDAEFGKSSTTMDTEGEFENQQVLADSKFDDYMDAIIATLHATEGEIWQTPPMYSAVKHQGQPLYKYARAGLEIKRKERLVQIKKAVLISAKLEEARLTAKIRYICSKGCYIRSLVDELGRKTGLFAYARELKRTAIGPYKLENSLDFSEILNWEDLDPEQFWQKLRPHTLPLEQAFLNLPMYVAGQEKARKLCHGQALALTGDDFITRPSSDLSFTVFC